MPTTYANNEKISALTVVLSIHTELESQIYDTEYPEHEWPNILLPEQIKRNVSVGATSTTYQTRDYRGTAAFIGQGPNNDIPMVGIAMGAREVPLRVSAVGFRITNEEARQYTKGFNNDLLSDLSTAAGLAADNLLEKSIIFGNPDLGLMPWINYQGIPVVNALARWGTLNAEQKVAALDDLLDAMWEQSNGLYMATDLYVPMAIYSDMVRTPMVIGGVGVAQSIMSYFEANNLALKLNGSLRISPSRYLSTAGADGQNRIVAMARNVKNQVFSFPMDLTIEEPVKEPLGAAWYGEQKFGSYHIRQRGSMIYLDGI